MIKVFKCDLYRIRKSKSLYLLLMISGIMALALVTLVKQDIRLGISIIGDITIFKNIEDIVLVGANYQKGLGVLIAIIISLFIGQEYLFKTWKLKCIENGHRGHIYLSKMIVSMLLSVSVLIIFQGLTLLFYGKPNEMVTENYIFTIVSAIFVYAALGAIICLFSIVIKNNVVATIMSLCYILLSETLISVLKSALIFSDTASNMFSWIIDHSVYGMNNLIQLGGVSAETLVSTSINAIAIILISLFIGCVVFKRYEL